MGRSLWTTLTLQATFTLAPCSATEPTNHVVTGHTIASERDGMAVYEETIPGTSVVFKMLPIAGGEFYLGSPADEPDRATDEGPQVLVKVDPFWMGRCEVTWAEYRQFMDLCRVFDRFNERNVRQLTDENTVDAVTAPSKLYDPSFVFDSGEDPNQPAVSMSQFAAKQYTKWLSLLTGDFYRLPTEAEWEYACRAGTTTRYSFGDNPSHLPEYGWFAGNSDEWVTGHVGQKKPNPWGLCDMHGNVAEWTLDEYHANRYAILPQGETAVNNLAWPTRLYPRVLRGGSWRDEANLCRSATRTASDDDEWRSYDPNTPRSPWWLASDEAQGVGFRIVRPLVAPPPAERVRYWDADVDSIQRDADRRIDNEGRGERGLVDPTLPAAILQLNAE
jgi:sulfatase modifying factor 1